MKALPLGSYISRQTPLHSLDARIKLILLLGVTIALLSAIRGTAWAVPGQF